MCFGHYRVNLGAETIKLNGDIGVFDINNIGKGFKRKDDENLNKGGNMYNTLDGPSSPASIFY